MKTFDIYLEYKGIYKSFLTLKSQALWECREGKGTLRVGYQERVHGKQDVLERVFCLVGKEGEEGGVEEEEKEKEGKAFQAERAAGAAGARKGKQFCVAGAESEVCGELGGESGRCGEDRDIEIMMDL